MGAGGRYKLRIHGVGRAGTSTVFQQAVFALCDSTKTLRCLVPASRAGRFKNEKQTREKTMKIRREPKMQYILLFFGQHRTIPTLRLKHRSGSYGRDFLYLPRFAAPLQSAPLHGIMGPDK